MVAFPVEIALATGDITLCKGDRADLVGGDQSTIALPGNRRREHAALDEREEATAAAPAAPAFSS